ncbi:hypothetical protein CRG98_022712 [Punica granatum]|uniref:Uncharacterized protein n=1 Tax=Punica granatum TaxID=22663 RepID=A0A2I0JLU1_PUNGR|nr:hypothetical protein CRG98_022712 [Punica granatum]
MGMSYKTTHCLVCCLGPDNFGPTFKVLAHTHLPPFLQFPSSVISIIETINTIPFAIVTPLPSPYNCPPSSTFSSTSIITSTIILHRFSSSGLVLLLDIDSSSISSAILSLSIIFLGRYTLFPSLPSFLRLAAAATRAYHHY